MSRSWYNVVGFCEDEEGERFKLGVAIVRANDEAEAAEIARDELWDERLSSAGCCFISTVAEEACAYCGETDEMQLVECDHCGADDVCVGCHCDDACCDGEK